jgi:fumarylacetoacetate (FAA) hydrolase
MRLATIHDGTRDGRLAVVDKSGTRFAYAHGIAPTLQAALDDWAYAEPLLSGLSARIALGDMPTDAIADHKLMSPLPRAYEWVDGSAFITHIVLVRKARNAAPPATLYTDPLVYQGGSSVLLGPHDDIPLVDESWGLDFEAEVCAILGDVAQGTSAASASSAIRLFVLANDVTLRNLVPAELEKGFGFFQSKPATAFSPFAVTPDELGPAYRNARVHLPLRTELNGALAGDPDAGQMHFSFADLIAHITKTRAFAAGTILGSGTVSNEDPARGISCLAERRARETIEHGAPRTRFLIAGDRVRIEMLDSNGHSIFGVIDQKVVKP